jgi:hypothetical protein
MSVSNLSFMCGQALLPVERAGSQMEVDPSVFVTLTCSIARNQSPLDMHPTQTYYIGEKDDFDLPNSSRAQFPCIFFTLMDGLLLASFSCQNREVPLLIENQFTACFRQQLNRPIVETHYGSSHLAFHKERHARTSFNPGINSECAMKQIPIVLVVWKNEG